MDKPKKLCKIAKNPCKICLQPVTHKNGLRCMGACEAWVHYECVNYTPGKIRDIKKKKIKVNCPCPDCVSTTPRETVSSRPYTCTNILCPANNPPACKNYDCQANELSRALPSPCPPPGSLRDCGSSRCLDSAIVDGVQLTYNNFQLITKRDHGLQVGGNSGGSGQQSDLRLIPLGPVTVGGASGAGAYRRNGACAGGTAAMVARMVGPCGPGSMDPGLDMSQGPGSTTGGEPVVSMDMMNKLIYVVRDLAGQVNILLGSLREVEVPCPPGERGGDEYRQERYYASKEGPRRRGPNL